MKFTIGMLLFIIVILIPTAIYVANIERKVLCSSGFETDYSTSIEIYRSIISWKIDGTRYHRQMLAGEICYID